MYIFGHFDLFGELGRWISFRLNLSFIGSSYNDTMIPKKNLAFTLSCLSSTSSFAFRETFYKLALTKELL